MRAVSGPARIACLAAANLGTYLRVTASLGPWPPVGFDKRPDSSHIVPSK